MNIFSDSLKTLLLTAQMDWCLCGTFLVLLTTQCALTLRAAFTQIFFVLSSMHAHKNACLRCIFRFDILACGLKILGTGPPNIRILSRKIGVPERCSATALKIWLYYDVCVVDVSMYVPVGVDRNQMFPDSTWQR